MVKNIEGQYDKKTIIRYAAIMVAIMLASKFTAGAAIMIIPFFVVTAIMRDRPVELVFWTCFMLFFSFANHSLFACTGTAVLVTRVALLIMTLMLAGQMFSSGKREARMVKPLWGIFLYAAWEAIVSIQGWQPIISYLKLFLFFAIYSGLIAMTNRVNRSSRTNAKILRSALLGFITVFIFGSVILIPFGIGQMGGEEALKALASGEGTSLFRGMTNQSQALGPSTAFLGVFLFADLVFSIKKFDKLYLILLACCFILIVKTSSRTGMGTFIAGLGMVGYLAMRSRGITSKWKSRLMSAMIMVLIAAGIAMVGIPRVRNNVAQFVLKYGSDTKNISVESVMETRQGKIDEMMPHIKKKPLQGNGFQVDYNMLGVKRSGIASYMSAPIEKGVWIYAVLEEGGIVGLLLLGGWAIYLIFTLISLHSYIGACMTVCMFIVNLGEFCLFSMSFTGGLYWGLIFSGICMDIQRMKASTFQVFDVPIEVVVAEEGMDAWTKELG